MKFIMIAILFHACASVFLKYGAIKMEGYTLHFIISNYFYFASLLFLLFQAISWQFALKKYDLHHAYVFMSLYYPFILVASYFIFNENITIGNMAGVVLIIGGLSLFPVRNGK
jgi:multidrug transporter EmrE-like cation transporter